MTDTISSAPMHDGLLTAMAADRPIPEFSWPRKLLRSVFKACAVCVNSRAAASLTVHSSCLALIGATVASPALLFDLHISSQAMIGSSAAAGVMGLGLWLWRNPSRQLTDVLETASCMAFGFVGVVASHVSPAATQGLVNHPLAQAVNMFCWCAVPAAAISITVGNAQFKDAMLRVVGASIEKRKQLEFSATERGIGIEREAYRQSKTRMPWLVPYLKTAGHIATIGAAVISTNYVSKEMSLRHILYKNCFSLQEVQQPQRPMSNALTVAPQARS